MYVCKSDSVALFTSAWIETTHFVRSAAKRKVALFTSAWIETRTADGLAFVALSRSSRARGLKL